MLRRRLLVSGVLIPLSVGLFALDAALGPIAPVFGVLIIVLSALMSFEMVTMLRHRFGDMTKADVVVAVGLMVGVGWIVHALPLLQMKQSIWTANLDSGWSGFLFGWAYEHGRGGVDMRWLSSVLLGLGASAAIVVVFSIGWLVSAAVRVERGTRELGNVVARIGAKLFVLVYVGGTVQLTSQIRWLGSDGWQSMRLLGALLIATKLGDVGGYFTGRFLGRGHPLKTLSPGKTGAGFVGALLTGTACTAAWLTLTSPGRDQRDIAEIAVYCLAGFVMAVLGIAGDLVESLVKRDTGVKDASSNLPGFGGVLDLLDSTLFTGAILVVSICLVQFVLVILSA